jgi:hypothetical protein
MTNKVAVKTRPEGFWVAEIEGNIFDAPENSVLIREYIFSSRPRCFSYPLL